MGISKASAQWNGGFKDGKGSMKPGHVNEVPFSAGTRFETPDQGSNPEEMIGAALAGCFSMALTVGLEKAGLKPQSVKTSANVHLERGAEGFSITKIELTTEAQVPGAEDAQFQQVAENTKRGCPVSKALSGGPAITLTAKLVQ